MKAPSKILGETRTLRPEQALILCCARTQIEPDIARRIPQLAEAVEDWDYLLDCARVHAVRALVHRNLRELSAGVVPAQVTSRLHTFFFRHTGGTLLLVSELLKLLAALAERGVQAVPFKGPVLGALAYGNPALRGTGDLDLLVRAADALRAKEVLIEAGYTPQKQFSPAEERALLKHNHQYGFIGSTGRVYVELQWGITRSHLSSPVDPGQIWKRLQQVSIGGKSVPSLGSQDLLLLLCAHGTKHCWSQLRWICDIAELVRSSPGLDWDSVFEQARDRGGERMLLLGLHLATDLLDAPLPPGLIGRTSTDAALKRLTAEVGDRLFPEKGLPRPIVPRAEMLAFNLRARERMREKVRCLRLLAAPSEHDEAVLPLPPGLRFLRYVVRPFRLTWQYGQAPARQAWLAARSWWRVR